MGKLIAIEGVDASGKETQTGLLYEKLIAQGMKVRKIRFPHYESDSSALVKMYLKGDFGSDANAVSPYIASTFYAADRYASFMTDWKKDYEDPDTVIIADRYTTANMIHQASKLPDKEEKDQFLSWLREFEYGLYGLPKPDLVLFLHMPLKKIREIIKMRDNKIDRTAKKDIHETNSDYMEKSYENALYIAQKEGFCVIDAADGKSNIKSIEVISDEVLKKVMKIL
jgi:Thymidylate kinase